MTGNHTRETRDQRPETSGAKQAARRHRITILPHTRTVHDTLLTSFHIIRLPSIPSTGMNEALVPGTFRKSPPQRGS